MNVLHFSSGRVSFRVLVGLLVAVGALMPVVVATSTNENPLRLLSKADAEPQMRIWLEPAAIVTAIKKPVVLSVMAEYPGTESFLSTVALQVHADEGLSLSQKTITYDGGFRGKVKVGEVVVTPTMTGKLGVWVDDSSINTGLPNVILEDPGKATIIVE